MTEPFHLTYVGEGWMIEADSEGYLIHDTVMETTQEVPCLADPLTNLQRAFAFLNKPLPVEFIEDKGAGF